MQMNFRLFSSDDVTGHLQHISLILSVARRDRNAQNKWHLTFRWFKKVLHGKNPKLSLKMLIYGFSVSNVVWNVHLLKIFWCFKEHQTTNVQSLEWCLFKCSCPDLNAFLFNSNSFTSYMSIVYILAHRRLSGYISQNIFLQKVLHIIYIQSPCQQGENSHQKTDAENILL